MPPPSTSVPKHSGIGAAWDSFVRTLFEVDETRLSPLRKGLLFAVRLGWLVVAAFFRDHLQLRAAALAFITILAFVPAGAVFFFAADSLGATDLLVTETIDPFLDVTFGRADDESLPQGVRGLRGTLDSLFAMVRETDVRGLGLVGVVVLGLAILRVVIGTEEAFGHIFQHRGAPRSFLRRARAFVVVSLVLPIGLSYAVLGAALTHGHLLMSLLELVLPFEPARDVLVFLFPPIAVTGALYLLYRELPDAQVARSSALLGAVLAAAAWYGLQHLHVRSVVGLGRWNAIYSGFGAFPLLLASIHLSWVIILLGAQVVAAHQNAPTLRQLARGDLRDHRDMQAVALRAAVELGRSQGWVDVFTLAARLNVGVTTLRDVLDSLVGHGLIASRTERSSVKYSLAVSASSLRAGSVLEALERKPDPELPWDDVDRALLSAIDERQSAANASTSNMTIESLVERTEEARISLEPSPPSDAAATVRDGTSPLPGAPRAE